MQTTFIYTLLDPISNIVRYVGKSNNPKKRLYEHLRNCYSSINYKNNWIKSLLSKNTKPILNIVDEVFLSDWEFWEKFWIFKYKKEGYNLTNTDDGGLGLSEHKYNTKEMMSKRHKIFPNYNKCHDKTHIIDKDFLYKKYITENLSIPKISKELGISEKTIFSNLKEFNITKEKVIWKQQCASHDRKTIIQYDLKGNVVDTYIGLIDIENRFGKKTNISNCCLGRAKTAYGFIWRYKDNQFDLGLDKLDRNTLRAIDQYDLDGNYINSFKSIKSASDITNINDGNIQSCCAERYKSAGGFIWKYK